jgi:hypothetical protein
MKWWFNTNAAGDQPLKEREQPRIKPFKYIGHAELDRPHGQTNPRINQSRK